MIRMTSQPKAAPVDANVMELAFWRSIDARSPDDLRAYLTTYPNGHFVALAKVRLAQMEAAQEQALTIDRIIDLVSQKSGVPARGFKSPRRARSYALARYVAMELARQFTDCTIPQIGRAFGHRDHTTVSHGLSRLREMRLIKVQPKYVQETLMLLDECRKVLLNEGRIVA